MEWNALEKPWQVCFELGWESLKKGSIPIGAVITNETGEIISKGRSMQFEDEGEADAIAHHKISHAELNAILKVSEFDHPDIRRYTIYTTTEPCPMCFGAIVMANIRCIKYAARDRYAGATELNELSSYIKSKNLSIMGPFKELEEVQIAIHTVWELMKNPNCDRLLNTWRIDSPTAVDLGISLAREGSLSKLAPNDAKASDVFNMVISMLRH